MMTKIPSGGAGLSNRSGSCGGLVAYLEKEQLGHWFGRVAEQVPGYQVTTELDANKRNLGRADDKYYQIVLAPSKSELAHIGSDPEALKAFTRSAMEAYAQNFGKGIESRDLVWYAKIEHSRSYDYTDRAVQLGEQAKGGLKLGDQTHIHVIVSRTENLKTYRQDLADGLHDRKNPYHLSPLTNHKGTTKGVVLGGFERNGFSQRVEQRFDQSFGYERGLTESFRYLHGMKYGDEGLKAELSQAAALERSQQREQAIGLAVASQSRQAELQAGLGQAYQQADVRTLSQALDQAEQLRQQLTQQRQQEATRQLELERVESLKREQQLEQGIQRSPRQDRGMHL
jgi:aminopeptidase N